MPESNDPIRHSDGVGRFDQGAASQPASLGGALILMLALFALVLVLVLARHHPPAPRPADAPAAEFSAGRAREVLRQLAGDGRPHPVGSAANDLVRQRITGILAALGYPARIEAGFACNRLGTCAEVRNVVARLPGREPGAAVAVAAHYDSVSAGPGASDDLAGVAAILEIARALKAGPPPRHPVVLLLDEGEESGLLGAQAFEDSSPEAGEVKAVVNLEARGTRGPSFMFETSGDNGWMIAAWAPRVPRPVTTSLAAAIYSLLPNDTDLTVFRHRGLPGLNFAFIGGAMQYHTPYDNLANASAASLQHQGDNALAAVAGLAEADLANPPRGNMVFFDVLSLGILRWPLGWTLGLAVLGLALLIAAAAAALRGGVIEGGDLGLGLLAVPATLVLTALMAYGLSLVLTATGTLNVFWLAHPLPAIAGFCLLSLAVAAALATMLGRRSATLGMWAGIWIVWAVLGAVLAVWVPAMSYIFVAPALVAGVCGLAAGVWRGRAGGTAAAAIVPGVAAALLWFGVVPAIYDGLGVPALPIISVLTAILLTTLAPLIGGGGPWARRLWAAALLAALVAAVIAMPQPRFSPQSPQQVAFTFYQDADAGAAAARWLVQINPPPIPAAVLKAAPFGPPGKPFPWSPPYARARSAPAPALAALTGPELKVVESTVANGKRHLRLHLLSSRGARDATVFVPASARPESVAIGGHKLSQEGGKAKPAAPAPGAYLSYADLTLPAAGCDLEMDLGETGPLDWYVVDSTPGLPPSGAALLAARPLTAVPVQAGDTTKIARRVRI